MIPLTGTKDGESYAATIGKRGDVALTFTGDLRGVDLALALGGRCVGERCHLTPGRAEKWYALWVTGFSVRAVRVEDTVHYRYAGMGRTGLMRREALKLALVPAQPWPHLTAAAAILFPPP